MAQATKPIPDGYHSIQPQLVFEDAAKAISFYQKAFGAKEVMRMPGPDGKIMHAELEIGDSRFFLMDTPPGSGIEPPSASRPSPASLMLYVPDADATCKRAVSAGAKETMPVADQFWGDRGGMLADPFGYNWFVATHVKDMTNEEIRRAQQQWIQEQAGTGAGTHA